MPGHAGPKAAEPANDQIDRHAGVGASHRASIMSGSSSWFILATMRAGCPARLFSISRCDQIEEPRPHGHRRDQERVEIRLERVAGQVVEEVDDVVGERWSQVSRPTSA